MNINVYIEDNLGREIKKSASALGKSRNAIIREAIKEWLMRHKAHQWPKSIKNFKGVAEFPSFESYRDELMPPKENPFE